jgi:hypothetical protein
MPIISSPNPVEAPKFVGYMAMFCRYTVGFAMKMRPWTAACSLLRTPCFALFNPCVPRYRSIWMAALARRSRPPAPTRVMPMRRSPAGQGQDEAELAMRILLGIEAERFDGTDRAGALFSRPRWTNDAALFLNKRGTRPCHAPWCCIPERLRPGRRRPAASHQAG